MSPHENTPNRDDLGFLQDMIEAVRSEAPDEAQWQAARRNLMAKLESSRRESWIMSTFRKIGYARIRWAAMSAVAVAAIALFVVFNPWGRGPRDLYAAAREQLHNARTMTVSYYSEALTFASLDNVTPGTMELAYKEPGRFRFTMEVGSWPVVLVVDHEAKKAVVLYPQAKMYDDMTFTPNREVAQLIDRLRSLPERADKVLGEQEMDGRTVQGFRVNQDKKADDMKNLVVWVDVKTGDPVRMEGDSELGDPQDPSGQKIQTSHNVWSNFKFNKDLPDSLFDTTPPDGWSVGPLTRSRVDRPPVEK
jgi:outer membrane lipoprotein-sorting protein